MQLIDLKNKIKVLKKMGAEVQMISEEPPILKVENVRLKKNLGINIILSSSDEFEICPEKEWGCQVEEKGFRKFILKFNTKP